MVKKIISTVLSVIWGINRVIFTIAGYLVLVLIDPIQGVIVYPKLWPGIQGETFQLFGFTMDTPQTLAAMLGFAMFALQTTLISNLIANIMAKKKLFESGLDMVRFFAALILSLFDTFFDSLLGFIVSGDWTRFITYKFEVITIMGWVFTILFGLLSACGEIGAEYIRLSNMTEEPQASSA